MSLFNTFSTNSAKENKGVPVEFSPNDDGTVPVFWVARQSKKNRKFQKVTRDLFKPYRRELQMGTMKNEVAEKLTMQCFVQGCLTKWENIQDRDGNEIPFNNENAMQLFSDLPDLYDTLTSHSENIANYQDEQLEEDAKN